MHQTIKKKLLEVLKTQKIDLKNTHVKYQSKMKPLTNEEAIGNPIHKDYPLLNGREIMFQAQVNGSKGVAFTDAIKPGTMFEMKLGEIFDLDLEGKDADKNRAIFFATSNALLCSFGLIQKTSHCKDEELLTCKKGLANMLNKNYKGKKILLVGYQPRFAEVISQFDSKIIDLDKDNIGKDINGTKIEMGTKDKVEKYVDWADLIFATSSTFINGSAVHFLKDGKDTIFFGVSGCAAIYLLDLKRYCYSTVFDIEDIECFI